jgi:hypothetical protein
MMQKIGREGMAQFLQRQEVEKVINLVVRMEKTTTICKITIIEMLTWATLVVLRRLQTILWRLSLILLRETGTTLRKNDILTM